MKAHCSLCRLDREIILIPQILAEGEGKVLVEIFGKCSLCDWPVLFGANEIALEQLDIETHDEFFQKKANKLRYWK